ncbi:PD-(D/E)XK nuclease family protein [Luteolibacter algae]|uniref:PD-(D/E)XK nuclease family protein n=2 Tax=Luteolibacter algae TaxID=454151 RepID=A0ABW5D7F0_9BACT
MLREALAESATAILAPNVTTPGALLHLTEPTIAPSWIERIAWIEVLESISPDEWKAYAALFPSPPTTKDWAESLAGEIVSLRTTLQDHLHNLFTASKFLADTPEADRWESLSRLENLAEKRLASWGFTSRSTALRTEFHLPTHFSKIILAGITEMPPCLTKALESYEGEVLSLIAAPSDEQDHFSELGLPLSSWADRDLPSSPQVAILADPNTQAEAAFQAVANIAACSSKIALGSADDQTGTLLAKIFTENGWNAFHPASSQPPQALVRWLHAWKNWLAKPDSRNLATLLTLPECSSIICGKRAQKLQTLNKIRDKHPAVEPPALLNLLAKMDQPECAELHATVSGLLTQRQAFLGNDFPSALETHLKALDIRDESSRHTLSYIGDFLLPASPIFAKLNRSHVFWLQLLLSELPINPAQPPTDRVIDVQGWLELLFEPGEHLVICGMNETLVPSRSGGEPWLSEKIRQTLQLNTDADRHARDAYLLHAMLRMRETRGTVHLFCCKNGLGGETFLPSRLLLQVPRERLVSSVKNLFREIEPPESDLIWTRDWKWQAPSAATRQRISITALKDYLSCPFRFYLKHLVRMSLPEPDRREMNARDFGSMAHSALEIWAKDPDARQLTDAGKISAYLAGTIDDIILRDFGRKPPLAIRIQAQSILQRLKWFANQQAISSAEGWEIIHVERKISIPSGEFLLSGIIDRVDRHRKTGQLRVIDYKTGDVKSIESEHRQKVTARTKRPVHIPEDAPAYQNGIDSKGKSVDFLWKNLQLPLYALAESIDSGGQLPIPCYVHLGKTEDNVKFTTWDSFSEDDLESARACADWIIGSIANNHFWPPADKVKYDDFALLSQNRPFIEAFREI